MNHRKLKQFRSCSDILRSCNDMLRRSPMPQSVGEKRRSDFGNFGYTKRDHEGLLLVASMKFVRFDHLGQFLAPGLEPATEERGSEPHKKKQRGGKRDHLPWPADYQRRLHATAELVRRWEKKMGYAETWKPWS